MAEACGFEVYGKLNGKWWDGYDEQQIVLFDDFRPTHYDFAALLQVFDRYPMTVEVKGDTVNLMCTKFVVTTPKDIESTYTGTSIADMDDIGQLQRRCIEIKAETWQQVKDDLEQELGEGGGEGENSEESVHVE